jgi:hypothetical protein
MQAEQYRDLKALLQLLTHVTQVGLHTRRP